MNELNDENLRKLMQFRPTLTDTASWFNVSEDTIERKIKKFEKMTFRQFKLKYSSNIKYRLMERAIDMAMTGNTTMMIFALKNICAWTDKQIVEMNTSCNNQVYYRTPDNPFEEFPEGATVVTRAYNPKTLTDRTISL